MKGTLCENGRKTPCLSVCEKKKMKRTGGPTKNRRRNWADLNVDLVFLIFMKVGKHNTIDLIQNAQYVCSSWRKAAMDARLYRSVVLQETRLVPGRICIPDLIYQYGFPNFAKEIIDRSCGQMEKFSVDSVIVPKKNLMEYLALTNGNSIKSLKLIVPFDQLSRVIPVVTQGFPQLEELNLRSRDYFVPKLIQFISRSAKKLKYLGLHYSTDEGRTDQTAVAIGKYMTHLHRLHISQTGMTNHGLEAILNGCKRLENFDLRRCPGVNLEADSLKKCVTSMKLQVHSVGECINFSKGGEPLHHDVFPWCLMCWQCTRPPYRQGNYRLKSYPPYRPEYALKR